MGAGRETGRERIGFIYVWSKGPQAKAGGQSLEARKDEDTGSLPEPLEGTQPANALI